MGRRPDIFDWEDLPRRIAVFGPGVIGLELGQALHRLGVEILPHMRLHGVDDEDAYFQHTLSGEAVVLEGVDTLVTALGTQSETALEEELSDWPGELHVIGDALSPRTVEEAVLEGLKVAAVL